MQSVLCQWNLAKIPGFIAGFTLYKFINYKKAHNKYFADVKNSEEYKNECIAAAQATEQKNQEIKANYEAQVKTAQTEYEAKVKAVKEDYDAALANLTNHIRLYLYLSGMMFPTISDSCSPAKVIVPS